MALAEVGRLAEDVGDLTDDRVGVAGLGEVSVVVVTPEDDPPSEGLDRVLGHFALFGGLHCVNDNGWSRRQLHSDGVLVCTQMNTD